MQYEVRFQVAGEEISEQVDAASAAEATTIVQEKYLSSSNQFELIQVTLLDDNLAHEFPAESDPVAN